jgi:hypothetical protein
LQEAFFKHAVTKGIVMITAKGYGRYVRGLSAVKTDTGRCMSFLVGINASWRRVSCE